MDKIFFKKLYDIQQSMLVEVSEKLRDSHDQAEWEALLNIASKMIDLKFEILRTMK
jgi:hypothetical protein